MMDNAWSGKVNEALLANYTKFKISKYQLDIDKHKTIYTVHTFEELKLEARGTIFLILNLILAAVL